MFFVYDGRMVMVVLYFVGKFMLDFFCRWVVLFKIVMVVIEIDVFFVEYSSLLKRCICRMKQIRIVDGNEEMKL